MSQQNIRTPVQKALGLEDEIDTWAGERVLAVDTEAGSGQTAGGVNPKIHDNAFLFLIVCGDGEGVVGQLSGILPPWKQSFPVSIVQYTLGLLAHELLSDSLISSSVGVLGCTGGYMDPTTPGFLCKFSQVYTASMFTCVAIP